MTPATALEIAVATRDMMLGRADFCCMTFKEGTAVDLFGISVLVCFLEVLFSDAA